VGTKASLLLVQPKCTERRRGNDYDQKPGKAKDRSSGVNIARDRSATKGQKSPL
jgi:hypothetical protein